MESLEPLERPESLQTSSLGWQGTYSAYRPAVLKSREDVDYLKESGIVLFSNTNYLPHGPAYMSRALGDMDPNWSGYINDAYYSNPYEVGEVGDTNKIHPAAVSTDVERAIKHAAQGCYQSYGPRRTFNINGLTYFENILEQEHGSVLEQSFVGLFIYGIPRDCSHEIVRHRVGTAFSQVSQRYVNSSHLRFIMRSEINGDLEQEAEFFKCIANAKQQYKSFENLIRSSMRAPEGTLNRKARQQAARTILPNCTETQMYLTGNMRFWRHFLTKRGSEHADTPVRDLAVKILPMMNVQAPLIFRDFETVISELDGKPYLKSKYGSV